MTQRMEGLVSVEVCVRLCAHMRECQPLRNAAVERRAAPSRAESM